MGIRYKSLHAGGDGAVFLNLSGTTISDLSPLTALSGVPHASASRRDRPVRCFRR
jgi:hypothetical protein